MRTLRLSAILIITALTAPSMAQDQPRQFYTDWVKQDTEGTQYMAKYYFKSNPANSEYQFQWVVWNKKWPDKVFYMNKDQKYWCAAPIGHNREEWFVFDEKADRIQTAIVPEKSTHPPIPQATDGAQMAFPKFAGIPGAEKKQ